MKKVYLKFRLEVLPSNYLLFQDLHLDKRFSDNAIFFTDLNDSIPVKYLKRIYNGEQGKDCLFVGKCKPQIIISENAIEHQGYLLKQFAELWKWVGFEDDFKNNTCKWYESTGKNGGVEYRFENSDNSQILLNYEIWKRDNFTFLKVNHADDCFIGKEFTPSKVIYDSLLCNPSLYSHSVVFNGFIPEKFSNTDAHKDNRLDINGVNQQVLKFLDEYIQKTQIKKPELVDLGNNIYEVSV